ncbi:DMT family transporter [Geomonas sp. RF6]|uniref:DMT family transporter n=1 Tax=Geomonas sp. RF6 TaxID=2897342 RepID=UPI001E2DE580|nr:DMT family transporter [Geomonas sp. RF6]UFS69407.1 DMT family transporter [Geomonas sp. RF6]
MTTKEIRLAYAALACGILCIGCSALFVKIAALPGTVSAFYRLFFAAPPLVMAWVVGKKTLPARHDLLLIAAGGALFAADLTFWNSGLLLTSAAAATLLANNAPIWVGLGALIFFRERLAPRFWLGLGLSLIGMALIVGPNALRELTFNRGDLLSIGASIFYAAYLLTTQKARGASDTLTFMTISVIAGAALLLVVNLALGLPLTGFSPRSWWALAGLGLVSHLVGWLAINYALGHLKASSVSVSLLGQAVVTALLSIPVLGETLGATETIGGVLVLGGIYLVNSRKEKRVP